MIKLLEIYTIPILNMLCILITFLIPYMIYRIFKQFPKQAKERCIKLLHSIPLTIVFVVAFGMITYSTNDEILDLIQECAIMLAIPMCLIFLYIPFMDLVNFKLEIEEVKQKIIVIFLREA